MKNLLIVFALLLLLLTLLGAFGGSLKYNEPFFEGVEDDSMEHFEGGHPARGSFSAPPQQTRPPVQQVPPAPPHPVQAQAPMPTQFNPHQQDRKEEPFLNGTEIEPFEEDIKSSLPALY